MVVAATLVPAHQAARRAGGGTWQALLMLDVAVVLGGLLVLTSERAWERVAQEDGVVEWATVFSFAAAAALLFSRIPAARRDKNLLFVVACVCIGAFCVFVAGEEISWGQRLFAFKPPDAFLEKNFQQELNVHNMLMDEKNLGVALESKHLVALIALLYGVVGPLLARIPVLAPAARAFPPLALAPAFLVVTATELTYRFELAGEGAELLLGLGFAAALAAQSDKQPVRWVMAPLALAVVVTPALARVAFGSDEAGSASARAELEALASDLKTGLKDKIDTKKSVHKRVFSAAQAGYLDVDGGAFLEGKPSRAREASGRDDRRGYFLDPWNNPYWIFAQRGVDHVVIYSFGPNRARETDLKKKRPRAEGDDIVVLVPRNATATDETPELPSDE